LWFKYFRTHQFAKSEIFDVFIFSSACNQFLLFDVTHFPLVAFVLFRDLSHKNATVKTPKKTTAANRKIVRPTNFKYGQIFETWPQNGQSSHPV